MIDLHTGEVAIDGPVTEEQAGAQEAFRKVSIKKLRRLFEVESALAKEPANKALKKELKDLQIYKDFFERVGERRLRLEVLRRCREALKGASEEGKQKTKFESEA
jgi:hypothetical protein